MLFLTIFSRATMLERFVQLIVILVSVGLWIPSTWLLLVHAPTSARATSTDGSACVKEFDPCVMPRDCCKGFECVAGDWAQTTDSTCLSRQSQNIASLRLTHGQQMTLVKDFYAKQQVEKTDDELEDIIKHFRPFARLVSRLEHKYHQPFQIPSDKGEETKVEL